VADTSGPSTDSGHNTASTGSEPPPRGKHADAGTTRTSPPPDTTNVHARRTHSSPVTFSRRSADSVVAPHHPDRDGDVGSRPWWKPAAHDGYGFVRMLYEPGHRPLAHLNLNARRITAAYIEHAMPERPSLSHTG
jgi:hypothetical protein